MDLLQNTIDVDAVGLLSCVALLLDATCHLTLGSSPAYGFLHFTVLSGGALLVFMPYDGVRAESVYFLRTIVFSCFLSCESKYLLQLY